MLSATVPRRRRPLVALALLFAVALGVALLLRSPVGEGGLISRLFAPSPPEITQEMVVTQLENVAKLVSTEMTVRDVVTFEQSRLGMRKRALLVVTGRVLAGIDLGGPGARAADVRIDHEARRIHVTLPRAQVLGVEVVSTRTWDEQEGLFYQITPADRDEIQRRVRVQLAQLGARSGLLPQAERSAALLLENLLARDGYTVEVVVPSRPVIPAG